MGKRVDNDATMDISTSQLVTDNPANDVSVWKQRVVESDQFAPSAPEKRDRRALWIALAFLVFTGVAAATYFLAA